MSASTTSPGARRALNSPYPDPGGQDDPPVSVNVARYHVGEFWVLPVPAVGFEVWRRQHYQRKIGDPGRCKNIRFVRWHRLGVLGKGVSDVPPDLLATMVDTVTAMARGLA